MASPGRLQEAEKHLAEAGKCLKTGLLKWSPDYANAANYYDKAAVCYRNARNHEKARDAYVKAADCHYNNHAIYHAGKSLEQAANVSRDARLLEEAAGLYKQASAHYNESGHPDSAGQTIVKGAQLLQHDNPRLAATYFLETAAYYELDEKYREAGNSVKNAVRMYCRTRPRQFDEIIKTARLSRESFLTAGAINMAHESVAVEILATLMQGRAIDAVDVLQEANRVPEFASSKDRTVLEELVDAVTQQDMETVEQCCNSGVFKSMDPEFAKLARDLKLGSDSVDPARQLQSKKTGAASGPPSSSEATTKLAAKDMKKKPAELANMRSQLLTKSTGETTSSKRAKTKTSGASYKPPPTEERRPEPPTAPPSDTAVPPQGRGLEEDEQPSKETKHQEREEERPVQQKEEEEGVGGDGDDTETKEVDEGRQEEEVGHDDDDDEPLDIN